MVLRLIKAGMMPGDLLMHSLKLDTPQSRLHFDFSFGPGKQRTRQMLELLNIDESYYDLEGAFDEPLNARFVRARLKVALTIRFNVAGLIRDVELHKGEAVLLLRVWHRNAVDVVNQL